MIKEFTKASINLLEAHKAPIDIKIGDQVFRDWEYQYVDRFGMLKFERVGFSGNRKRIVFDKHHNEEFSAILDVEVCDNLIKDDIRIHPEATFQFRTSRKWIKRERKRLGEAKQKIRDIANDFNAPLMRQALEGMWVNPAMSFKDKAMNWMEFINEQEIQKGKH